jgi:hypothetical protein
MRIFALIIIFFIFSASINADASNESCEMRTKQAFPNYELTPGSKEKGLPTHVSTKRYSKTTGDYDGDRKKDIALLLRPKSGEGKYAISVCLSSKPSGPPELIKKAYTDGPLSTTPKGRGYHDFETNEDSRYELDGIGSYCCECCGATYIYRDDMFEEIIDSD